MYPVSQKALPTARQAVADRYTRLIVGCLIHLFKSIITPEKLLRKYGTSEILSIVSLEVIICVPDVAMLSQLVYGAQIFIRVTICKYYFHM
jgi:hypothetical protein